MFVRRHTLHLAEVCDLDTLPLREVMLGELLELEGENIGGIELLCFTSDIALEQLQAVPPEVLEIAWEKFKALNAKLFEDPKTEAPGISLREVYIRLLYYGQSECLRYGLEMVETSLKTIAEIRDSEFKEAVSSVRWGSLATQESFEKMMQPKDAPQKIASMAELKAIFG